MVCTVKSVELYHPKICKHILTVLDYDFLRQQESALEGLANGAIDKYLNNWDYEAIRQDPYYENMTNEEIDKLTEEFDPFDPYDPYELFQIRATTYEEQYGKKLYKHPLCNGKIFKYQEKEGILIDKLYGDYLSIWEKFKD